MQDTAPQKTLRDGAYTWRAVQPFGPSTAHRAEVEGGRVSVWQTGEGEGLFTTPAAYLEDASLFAAALLEVIEGRTRYGTSPVDFEPAPLPPIGNARAARQGPRGAAHRPALRLCRRAGRVEARSQSRGPE